MPISGITTQRNIDEFAGRAMPTLLTLHKGAPKTAEGYAGKDLAYFRPDFTPEYKAYVEGVWFDLYGKTPQAFNNVYLLGDTPDFALTSYLEEWNAKQALVRRCDGEHIHLELNGAKYEQVDNPCIRAGGGECGCKPRGYMSFMFPELVEVSGVIGTVRLNLGSIIELASIYNYLVGIQRMSRWPLSNIPMTLGRQEREVSIPDTKKNQRMKVTKSLVYIQATPEFVKPLLAAGFSGDMQVIPPALQASNQNQLPALLPNRLPSDAAFEPHPNDETDETPPAPVKQKNVPSQTPPVKTPKQVKEERNQTPVQPNGIATHLEALPPADLPNAIDTEVIRVCAIVDKEGRRLYDHTKPIPEGNRANEVRKEVSKTLNSFLLTSGVPSNELDDMRHLLLDYIFGIDSSKAFTEAVYQVFMNWSGGKRTAYAKREVENILLGGWLSGKDESQEEAPVGGTGGDFDQWLAQRGEEA